MERTTSFKNKKKEEEERYPVRFIIQISNSTAICSSEKWEKQNPSYEREQSKNERSRLALLALQGRGL